MRIPRAFVIVAVALLSGLSARAEPPPVAPPAPPATPVKDPDLERLAAWMTGTFTSAAQSHADPDYRDIRLTMAPIWKDRSDGPWLYVEQAMTQALDRPYRQRVYQVVHTGGTLFESRVFALPEPAKAVGAWKAAAPLADVTPDQLKALEGCTVVLRRLDDATFRGATLGSACENAFGKAVYATSEVTVTADGLRSWDRGYDAEHKQVWGAEKGPYVFVRMDPAEAAKPVPAAFDPWKVKRIKSMDNVRVMVRFYLASVGMDKPWPKYSGKAFVLWLVASNKIDRRDPKQLEILFSPADEARSLEKAGGVEAYANLTLESLKAADPGRGALTSYAGPRNGEKERAITPTEIAEGAALLADLSFPDGAILGYTSGAAKWLTREELGLGPNDPIVAGDASKSPLLRHLSSE